MELVFCIMLDSVIDFEIKKTGGKKSLIDTF